jgi:hypothetical protein
VTEAFLVVEVVIREHLMHVRLFLNTDAMFTRKHPTSSERGLNDLCTSGMNTVVNAGLLAVEQQEWVKVAVTCMEDVDDGEVVFIGDSVHLFEGVGEL